MKHISIRSKLLVFVGVLVTVMVLALTVFTWLHLKEENNSQNKRVQEVLFNEIRQNLTAQSQFYGQQVAGFINEAYRIPYTFAGLLNSTSAEKPLTRESVQLAISGALAQNKLVSSMYPQFEKNGYDV